MRIASLFPELLGTYGDAGNALVLGERARRRGLVVEVVSVSMDDAVPSADLYLLGGGEDGPQRLACELLSAGSLASRVADGAFVVAVCAGLQLLGTSFSVEGDDDFPGLGVVDVVTRRGERRSVGDLATRVGDQWLVGFENHGGVTTRGPGVGALGEVVRGRGNDGVSDGVRSPRVWATYAHGPVMAINPWFADAVLADVVGHDLAPLAGVADDLHASRVAALGLSPSG
ncbi:MAG: type 1 glutamine amidotransferase [Acidimicrobiales bacterium]